MAAHSHSKEAHLRANERYLKKTYTQIQLRLRKEDDKEIIDSIRNAQENGTSIRQWVRDLFYNIK